ncbi:hemolysin XhlA family protein [Yoonia sp. R2331]|uniref:hemolysin XhlA family protein n=1 Tax=Yoonia sp. R2331 TaxID=3237238 RepID=UPI0034E49B1D
MGVETGKTIEARVAALETHNAVTAVHQANVARRLGSIEDTLKWLVRLVIGGLILGMITYIVQGGLMP